MSDFTSGHCEACRVGAPLLTSEELDTLLPEIPEWKLVKVDGIDQLERQYTFKNFIDAQSFTNRVCDLSEKEGHHPAILLEWGKVKVSWWTHKIHGLHRNDVLMAAKTDKLFTS
jgi:4a-hydroxytetrahydrobiopterin dehydratase